MAQVARFPSADLLFRVVGRQQPASPIDLQPRQLLEMFSRRGGLTPKKDDDVLITPHKKRQRSEDSLVASPSCPSSGPAPLACSSAASDRSVSQTGSQSGGRATQKPIACWLGTPITGASELVILQALGWKMALTCRGCGATSVSPDPVAVRDGSTMPISVDSVRKWQYSPEVPKGQMCWYCARVYLGVFKPRGTDWYTLTSTLALFTGLEFCVFFHQLDQALIPTVICGGVCLQI